MTGRRSRVEPLVRLFSEPWLAYAVFLCCFGFVLLLRWPIIAGDSDLWYHLSGGRYILAHGALPHDSYFSFLEPPKTWIDYYWLFQVLVYAVYSHCDYYGLIVLRAVAYLATSLGILRLLFQGQVKRAAVPWCAFIGISCALILLPRNMLVRPHLFTYLFTVGFLYIYEVRPSLAWCLPLLGLCWCNVHGVTYPIMVLIIGSYAAEWLFTQLRARSWDAKQALKVLLPSIATLATVLLTPHGRALVGVPLTSTVGASHYILELRPLHLWDILSFQFVMMTPTAQTVFNVLLLLTCLTAVTALLGRRLRVSHLLLFLSGWVLLLRGARFVNDYVLLALPMLRAHPLLPSTRLTKRLPKPVYLVGVGILLLIPMRVFLSTFSEKPRYPFSQANLPQGNITFLNTIRAQGNVLNHPNTGGYLQWMLYPTYRIFMDMEVPFLFSDEDMYLAQHVFTDEQVLGKVVARYRPGFLTVPNKYETFPEKIANFPDYVPVFFDDFEVLFVDRGQYPKLAEAYALRAVKPFSVMDKSVDEILEQASDRSGMLQEMERMLRVYPDCGTTNHIAAVLKNDQGDYRGAMTHAERIMKVYPESTNGYRLEGDALKGLKRYKEAISFYDKGIQYSSGSGRARLYKSIGLAHLELQQYDQAYRLLKESVEVYSPRTKREDLYSLGIAAMRTGRGGEARTIFGYIADYLVGPEDVEWKQKIHEALRGLDAGTGT